MDSSEKKLPLNKIRREQEEKRAEQRAVEENYPYVNLTTTTIDREAIVLLNEKTAKEAKVAVIQKVGKRLELVAYSTLLEITKNLLQELTNQGYIIDIFIASASSMEKAWQIYKIYTPPQESLKGTFRIEEEVFREIEQSFKNLDSLKEKISTLPTSEILHLVIAGAYFSRASDIHLEPTETFAKLRYRIDGVLHDIVEFKKHDYEHMLSRVKILSGLKINIHDTNQDGRFTIHLPQQTGNDTKVDVRVSILPGSFGETIVMRLLGIGITKLSIEQLGLRPEMFSQVKEILLRPNGLILTTGPTGSGKTTTLYSFLNYVKNTEIKIITVEDPIEYQLDGITQSQVNPEEGYSFATALRAIVRQDPDVILVGEIRDRETADTAIQASLTGHLVLSTLHTNDAPGAIPRLRDLGADEKSVTTALNLVIAQRLVRMLCPHCKEMYDPTEEEKIKLETELNQIKNRSIFPVLTKIYRAKGCEKCLGLGYWERSGIFEVFTIDPELERLILSRATHTDILALLKQQGFITMKQDGYLKVVEGTTSIEEVDRVT